MAEPNGHPGDGIAGRGRERKRIHDDDDDDLNSMQEIGQPIFNLFQNVGPHQGART